MATKWTMALLVAAMAAGNAEAQKPKGLTSKVKGALKGAVDSAASKAAAAVVDSALGTGQTNLADGECPPGMVPVGGAATVGAALVTKVRGKGKPTPATPAPCGPDAGAAAMMADQQAAAMAAAQAQAAMATQGAVPGAAANEVMGAVVGATPLGLAATVGAPMAVKGVKAIGGLLGKGAPTAAAMIKDLSTKGRLELKGIRFIGSSDALEPGFEDDLTMLAEALHAMEGPYLINVPAEAADQAAPDTTMARRRVAKLSALAATAGVPENRVRFMSGLPGLDARKKAPKPGEARVEVLKVP